MAAAATSAACDQSGEGPTWTAGFGPFVDAIRVFAESDGSHPAGTCSGCVVVCSSLINAVVRGEYAFSRPLLLPVTEAPPHGRPVIVVSLGVLADGCAGASDVRIRSKVMAEALDGSEVGVVSGCSIRLNQELQTRQLVSCLLHELGHALGLSHPSSEEWGEEEMLHPKRGGFPPGVGGMVVGERLLGALSHLYSLPSQRISLAPGATPAQVPCRPAWLREAALDTPDVDPASLSVSDCTRHPGAPRVLVFGRDAASVGARTKERGLGQLWLVPVAHRVTRETSFAFWRSTSNPATPSPRPADPC
jgi:hypothetical protein